MKPIDIWYGAIGATVVNFLWIAGVVFLVWGVWRSLTGGVKKFVKQNSHPPISEYDLKFSSEWAQANALWERVKAYKVDAAPALRHLKEVVAKVGGPPAVQKAYLEVAESILKEPAEFSAPDGVATSQIPELEAFLKRDHAKERLDKLVKAYAPFIRSLPQESSAYSRLKFEAFDTNPSYDAAPQLYNLAMSAGGKDLSYIQDRIWEARREKNTDIVNYKKIDANDPDELLMVVRWAGFGRVANAIEPLPVAIPEKTRFAGGTFVLGPPGSGKTTLLQYLFTEDIKNPQASVVVIDSQQTIIPQLATLKEIQNRLILIEPGSVAINPFTIKGEQGIDLITFILGALGGEGSDLTWRQNAFFRPCLRLLLEVPGATFKDFYFLLQKGGELPYLEYLPRLSDTVQQFFRSEFNSKTGYSVREELSPRLRPITEDPVYEQMFCSPTQRFNLFELLDQGKIILIDTDKRSLGPMRSSLFGRMFVALLYRVAMQRAADKHPPVYVYIDEAHEYLQDDQIADMLDEVRKRNFALTLATQRLEKIKNPNMLSAMMATAVKFARAGEGTDAHKLALQMQIDAKTLLNIPPRSFALSVRDIGHGAKVVRVPDFTLSKFEHVSSLERVRARTKELYGPLPESSSRTPPPRDDPPKGKTSRPVDDDDGPPSAATDRL